MSSAAALALGTPTEEQLASLTAEERGKYDYLKEHVMPTLSSSLQALLREREARQTVPGAPPPLRLVELNALSFVAQHLMRNNPSTRATAGASDHPR
ncbi:hypothetical protein KFE25_007977 [Diacronema lutheri]|uniref:Uncharacterized protein n=2 Tax=Diacronema lutheri TaxID=2081491 RepID=A0A8J6CGD5_DIALT|nr:hypothetical protein KFE25_007977 [Diacronema lutheri]